MPMFWSQKANLSYLPAPAIEEHADQVKNNLKIIHFLFKHLVSMIPED
jgi:hypothetical protein